MAEDLPYRVEYSKSNRAKCHFCQLFIDKDTLRIAKIVQNPHHDGKWLKWHHHNCFFQQYHPKTTGDIAHFDCIRWEDQEYIKKKIYRKIPLEVVVTGTASTSSAGYKRSKDTIITGANEVIIKYADEENVPPEAKKKKINHEPEYSKEDEDLKVQQEKLFNVRDILLPLKKKELIEMLKANGQRVPVGRQHGNSEILDALADAILFGALEPCRKCGGKFEFKSGTGYKCTGSVSKWARCENITQDPSRRKFDIPEQLKQNHPFLESLQPKVLRRLIKITSPSTSSTAVSESYLSNVQYGKSPSNVRLRVKGGGAVDPDSGLEDVAHVYQRDEDKFTVTLGITDIQTKKNSYYKLQILKDDTKNKFWLFRSWGRIGTTIGNHKCESMTLNECIEQFEKLYKEKSGNAWSCRDQFVKVPYKMYPIDIDHADDDNDIDLLNSSIESKLEQPVQDLIQLIFNEKQMKEAMLEYEIDMDKMPLGKISKKQIQEAYFVLSELLSLVKSGSQDRTKYIAASNKFYTLIPHNFGVEEPNVIDTEEEIQTKNEMLKSLWEMEIAYTLLYTERDGSKNPLDAHYEQLKTNIKGLDRESDEFKLIERYAKNTHAITHKFNLSIEEVFAVKRDGEESRYKPYEQLPNRKLLWHGSRVTNFVGILSQGLMIAPPEAPRTGYMFGKGIYFADMVSKSANYCRTNSQNSTGLLLLCDVALGNMYERFNADYIEKLPRGYHSTWGRGQTLPDPEQSVKLETGVEVPCGPRIRVELESELLYNEFVVYDVAQVKVEYLVRMKFEPKSTATKSSQSTTSIFAGVSATQNSIFAGRQFSQPTLSATASTSTQMPPTANIFGGGGSTSTKIGDMTNTISDNPNKATGASVSDGQANYKPIFGLPPTANIFGNCGSTSTKICDMANTISDNSNNATSASDSDGQTNYNRCTDK